MTFPKNCQGARLIPHLFFTTPRLWLLLRRSKMASRAPAIISIIQNAEWMKKGYHVCLHFEVKEAFICEILVMEVGENFLKAKFP